VRFRTRQSQMIVAFLGIKSGQEVSREAVIEAVWPDVAVSVGRNRLSTELSYLRSELEQSPSPLSILVLDRRFIRLRTDELSIDLSQAYGAAARSSLESHDLASRWDALQDALRIAGEPLLLDLQADWITSEANRFDGVLAQAALNLSRDLRAAGDSVSALNCVQTVLRRVDREALSLAALRLASEARRPADVIGAYEHYRKYLAENYGSEPSLEAETLVEHCRVIEEAGCGSDPRALVPP